MWDPTPKSPGAGGVCSLTVPPHSVPDILVPLPDRTETGRHKIVTNGSRGSPSMVPAAAAVSYARPAGDPSPGRPARGPLMIIKASSASGKIALELADGDRETTIRERTAAGCAHPGV